MHYDTYNVDLKLNKFCFFQKKNLDHWSDVLIGWLQGTASSIIVCVFVAKLDKKRKDTFFQPWLPVSKTEGNSIA